MRLFAEDCFPPVNLNPAGFLLVSLEQPTRKGSALLDMGPIQLPHVLFGEQNNLCLLVVRFCAFVFLRAFVGVTRGHQTPTKGGSHEVGTAHLDVKKWLLMRITAHMSPGRAEPLIGRHRHDCKPVKTSKSRKSALFHMREARSCGASFLMFLMMMLVKCHTPFLWHLEGKPDGDQICLSVLKDVYTYTSMSGNSRLHRNKERYCRSPLTSP